MFKEDGTAYGLAQSRIATMRDATSIGVPIIGGWLAMRDVRLPWLVATVIHLFQVLICMRCLEETLPEGGQRMWIYITPLSLSAAG